MNAAWDRAFDSCTHDAAGRRVRTTLRFGIQAFTTPPWAQDVGHDFNSSKLTQLMSKGEVPFMVFDLPAGTACPTDLPRHTWATERHTRQSSLTEEDPVETWSSHRKKQLRRAEREGFFCSECKDLDLLVELHQAARTRKGLNSDGQALHDLLAELLKEEDTHAWVVRGPQGDPLAGGVFHGSGDGRCVYGFGGQFRKSDGRSTSRASVMLIAQAMRHAARTGKSTFDFGGSRDPGVDRFYAEFGAGKVIKWKLIRTAWWLRPALRWVRPDLF